MAWAKPHLSRLWQRAYLAEMSGFYFLEQEIFLSDMHMIVKVTLFLNWILKVKLYGQ